MKKSNIILLSLFFITPYIKAEMMPQMEPSQVTTEKTGFFSFGIGGEVIPADSFIYYASVLNVRYGGILSKQSSFTAGLKITTHNITNSFLAFQYAYNFIESHKWVPGIDVSLLLGFHGREEYSNLETHSGFSHYVFNNDYYPSVGLELGPYLKTFISKKHALLLRTGVTIDTTTWNDGFDGTDFRAYLNLAIQWYF